MTGKTQSVTELNALRHRAVQLRLDGMTLAAVREAVGLSAPTIIAATKAWHQGGWAAVDVKPRGRPRRSSQQQEDSADWREELLDAMVVSRETTNPLWTLERVKTWLAEQHNTRIGTQTVASWLTRWQLNPTNRYRQLRQSNSPVTQQWREGVYAEFLSTARRQGAAVLWAGTGTSADEVAMLYAHDLRGRCHWITTAGNPTVDDYRQFFTALMNTNPQGLALVLPAPHLLREPDLQRWQAANNCQWMAASQLDLPASHADTHSSPTLKGNPMTASLAAPRAQEEKGSQSSLPTTDRLSHLQRLEAESMHIMREVVAEADNPVMMYSIGKDSAVMLHLARKAFYPARPPFPLLHVDTTWKFRAMYEFRDRMVEELGFDLITHVNEEGVEKGVNPFTHGSGLHTDIMKTEALKQALDKHGFDVAFGGARRDEEKSRAKERIFSFRTAQHRWEPKSQRPELWNLYNARKQRGESIRVFPLSNWTELDIWQYIHQQNIPIVPLYFAAERPVVERDGMLIMVDDERMPLRDGEVPVMRKVRFRTLGCYPLTAAVDSSASTLTDIIQEMLLTKTSERQGRLIDHDSAASMEKKKQEGYF